MPQPKTRVASNCNVNNSSGREKYSTSCILWFQYNKTEAEVVQLGHS